MDMNSILPSTGILLVMSLVSLLIVPLVSYWWLSLRPPRESKQMTDSQQEGSVVGESSHTESSTASLNKSSVNLFSPAGNAGSKSRAITTQKTEDQRDARSSWSNSLLGTTTNDDEPEIIPKSESNNWRCVCENGGSFLPASLVGPVAVLRMGSGQCYHKQTL